MRILFLSPRQCWPAHGGAKLREYYILRAAAKVAEVTYAHFTDPGSAPLTRVDLPFLSKVAAVPKPPAYGIAQAVRGIAGRWPLPVLNYTSPEMTRAVERLAAAGPFDFVHLEGIHLFGYAGLAAGRVVYDWHNIESEAMRRYSATAGSPARRWYASITAGKLETLERDMLRHAFGHIVCSERERRKLQSQAPSARLAVVENGVDCSYFERLCPEAGKDSIVFVARMDNVANATAAKRFARFTWPRIRARMPGLRLLLVGAEPLPSVRALADLPGVEVTGTVDDIRPYYQRALAAVVPLLSGSGTRLKIFEAMAARAPVISTPLGAEGLDAVPGEHLLIAEPGDAEAWLRHLIRLDGSPEERERLNTEALAFVRSRYDWEILGAKLARIYESWSGESV